MDNHGITMKGDFETDNIKSKDGVDVIEITDATGKIAIKTSLQIESGTPSNGYVLQTDGSGNASWSTPAIPAGEVILFEKDTAVTGYTLLNTIDDEVVYISSGGAGGLKSGSTWTQPSHTHSGPVHNHDGPSHTHSIGGHVHTTGSLTLTESQIPSHNHGYRDRYYIEANPNGTYYESTPAGYNSNYGSSGSDNDNDVFFYIDSDTDNTGSGNSHNHGNTGASSGNTGAGGTENTDSGGFGNTSSSATLNTWRPRGRNYTRQQKD